MTERIYNPNILPLIEKAEKEFDLYTLSAGTCSENNLHVMAKHNKLPVYIVYSAPFNDSSSTHYGTPAEVSCYNRLDDAAENLLMRETNQQDSKTIEPSDTTWTHVYESNDPALPAKLNELNNQKREELQINIVAVYYKEKHKAYILAQRKSDMRYVVWTAYYTGEDITRHSERNFLIQHSEYYNGAYDMSIYQGVREIKRRINNA